MVYALEKCFLLKLGIKMTLNIWYCMCGQNRVLLQFYAGLLFSAELYWEP